MRSVRCGAVAGVPPRTKLGIRNDGPGPSAGVSLTKSEYWNTASFSRDDRTGQLWFTFTESKLLVLVAQAEWAMVGPAPLAWVL